MSEQAAPGSQPRYAADAMNSPTTALRPEEIETFACGLYHLAACDSIDPREEKLIRDFLRETGVDLTMSDLQRIGFDPLEAAQTLNTTHLRRVFIKTAIALVRADGTYSANERLELGTIADVFGISNREFGQLELEVAGVPLT
jgi:23S rRNA U2552 (ribose-2'-O)-methylase RlmE/FtsJ